MRESCGAAVKHQETADKAEPVTRAPDSVSKERLRPCPFCGNSVELLDSGWANRAIVCGSCGAVGPTAPSPAGKFVPNERAHFALWNRRPVEDEQRKAIGDLFEAKATVGGTLVGKLKRHL